jgi:hypothetical protein
MNRPEPATVRYRTFISNSARWDRFDLRPDDIVISTPPKCGTTWLQMICALLVFQSPELPRPLGELSPWLDALIHPRDDVVAQLEAQTHRRFIKTHTPLDGLPFDPDVTYICAGRDPRDIAVSMDNHLGNMNIGRFVAARQAVVAVEDPDEAAPGAPPPRAASEVERFWAWVDLPLAGNHAGLAATMRHLGSFLAARDLPNVVMLRYEDLQVDLEREMRRLAARLGIAVPEQAWPGLVEAATFDRMRARAADLVPEQDLGLWQETDRFFHRGTSEQWRRILTDADLPRYVSQVCECAPDDLIEWVHNPPLPMGSREAAATGTLGKDRSSRGRPAEAAALRPHDPRPRSSC